MYCNNQKNEFISSEANAVIHTFNAKPLKETANFIYLGLHIAYSEKDFEVWKALAWNSCNKLDKIWHFNLPR